MYKRQIQFSSGENDSGQTGTVTTGGGNLNVRTGAGMDYTCLLYTSSMMAGSGVGGVFTSSYLSEDADMLAAEAAYCELEQELQYKLDH